MDFIQAKRALTNAGFDEVSLEDLAKDWIKYKTKITSTASIGECYEQWLNDMDKKADFKTRSKQSVENYKRTRKHLLPYFDFEIGEFVMPELAKKFAKEYENRKWKSLFLSQFNHLILDLNHEDKLGGDRRLKLFFLSSRIEIRTVYFNQKISKSAGEKERE